MKYNYLKELRKIFKHLKARSPGIYVLNKSNNWSLDERFADLKYRPFRESSIGSTPVALVENYLMEIGTC